MSQPFVGEIRIFAGNFAPVGWALCQGQLLPISQNPTLFQLIGTTYGGDGQSTFALPNLASRVPVHQGNGYVIGQAGGTESVTLTTGQIPGHNHLVQVAAGGAGATTPNGNVLAGGADTPFSDQSGDSHLAAGAVAPSGGSQPHDNMLPFVAVNFIISLFGVFPSQS